MLASSRPSSRISTYHTTKRHLLGNQAGNVPPSWRDQKPKEQGSKILLSRLPTDVGELEVEELFRKTVGPLKEVFLVYNPQGRSRGMAIVSFQRSGDAAIARAKYDGKFIDGRRPIKIEIIVDSEQAAVRPLPAQTQPSLLGRLGLTAAVNPPPLIPSQDPPPNGTASSKGTHAPVGSRKQRAVTRAPLAVAPRRRQKKGPRRVKKTYAQLDQEMDEYRAAAPTMSFALNMK